MISQATTTDPPQVLIGVLTAKDYESRRNAVRATWGRDAESNPHTDIVFLIGDPSLKLPRRDGDILYLPCPDDYASLPQKTRWFCLWALAYGGAWRWLFKCDDDTYLRVDRLLAGSWNKPVVGCRDGDGRHWHGGAGYLIDREAAQAIAARLTNHDGFEDQLARDAIRASGLWFQHDPKFCFDKSRMPTPENEQITCHYVSPVRMRLLHDAFAGQSQPLEPRIPKVIHHIWLGGEEMAPRLRQFRESWLDRHPDWTHKLWTDADLSWLQNSVAFNEAPTPAQKSHIARYEILLREGGVYVDCDVECNRPIDDLVENRSGFAAAEDDDVVGIAVLGSAPGTRLLRKVVDNLEGAVGRTGDVPCDTGSWFFTGHFLEDREWQLFWWKTFYPVHHSGRIEFAPEEAYARHHWEASWRQ